MTMQCRVLNHLTTAPLRGHSESGERGVPTCSLATLHPHDLLPISAWSVPQGIHQANHDVAGNQWFQRLKPQTERIPGSLYSGNWHPLGTTSITMSSFLAL